MIVRSESDCSSKSIIASESLHIDRLSGKYQKIYAEDKAKVGQFATMALVLLCGTFRLRALA